MRTPPQPPTRDVRQMEDDFDTFSDDARRPEPAASRESNSLDMYIENHQLVAEFSLPHFKRAEVHAAVDAANGLEISAEHHESHATTRHRQYWYHETSDRYLRRVSLPPGADTEHLDAVLKDGILTVTMPYTAPETPIPIAREPKEPL